MTARRPSGVKAALLLVGVAAPLVLSGCAPGLATDDKSIGAATAQVATGSAGTIAVRGVRLVVPPASATPTPPGTSSTTSQVPSSPQGYLLATLVNGGDQPDLLTNATLAGGALQPGSTTASLTIQPHETLTFGAPIADIPGPTIDVVSAAEPLRPGTTVEVTMTFRDNGSVTLQVPVKDPAGVGTTQTARPVPLTGSYPAASESPEEAPTAG